MGKGPPLFNLARKRPSGRRARRRRKPNGLTCDQRQLCRSVFVSLCLCVFERVGRFDSMHCMSSVSMLIVRLWSSPYGLSCYSCMFSTKTFLPGHAPYARQYTAPIHDRSRSLPSLAFERFFEPQSCASPGTVGKACSSFFIPDDGKGR